jgi:capsular polysaccharide biosynthesis protein
LPAVGRSVETEPALHSGPVQYFDGHTLKSIFVNEVGMAANSGSKPRVLIFGASSGGFNFYRYYGHRYQVVGFLDNNQQKHGQKLFGKIIYPPQQLDQLTYERIIIASEFYLEINEQLLNEFSIPEERIVFFQDEELEPLTTLEKWISKQEVLNHERMCNRPSLLASFLGWLFMRRHEKSRRGRFKRLTLSWLDTMTDNKVHVFRESRPDTVQAPRNIGAIVQPIAIRIPEVALYHFQDAQLRGVSRAVVLGGKHMIHERVLTAFHNDADYSNGSFAYHSDTHALLMQHPLIPVEKGILINSSHDTNYYHFLLEALSQLQFIAELPERYADYPILISISAQKIPSFKDFVTACNISRPFIFLQPSTTYQVKDVLFITAPNNLIANPRNGLKNVTESGFVRKESLDFMRSIALPLGQAIDPATVPKRVFMARRRHRRSYNQEEIFAVLERQGFSQVYMEDLSFSQQVALMANAEAIVGPTGAAWTNVIFASSGAKALCWMAADAGEVACFSDLASKVGVDMDYIRYQAGTSDVRQLYSLGYYLDPGLVSTWVQEHLPDLR